MFQYFGPPGPPYDQGDQPGRPPSRLEVQQQLLDYQKNQYRELQHDLNRPSLFPLGGSVMSLRRSLGGMLMSLGAWMSGEAARTGAGPEALARR